ncbi:hypothetical protein DRO42_02920 [Candidatus Bathyarchaeota archaeon]|nr:MAG: hypothetical protein DRO42_02920 [Candidatus Bathyarchaeota archaeon]
MLPENQVLLETYLSSRRLSPGSKNIYTSALKSWDERTGVPLARLNAGKLELWYRSLTESRFSASTIITYAQKLRILYRFALQREGRLGRREARSAAAEAFEAIPLADLRREEKKEKNDRDRLVLPEEFEALMRTAKHPRVKALIAVLYESGCRKGEILGLRIRDLVFGEAYAEIRIKGKTGERTIPLVYSVPYLRAWLQVHPDRAPLNPLFATVINGEIREMNPSSPNFILKELSQKAGLVRIIHPHMLRHTRLTELARSGLGEYQLKSFAGWTPDSRMAARYIHLAGRDHVAAVLEAQGVPVEAVRAERPRPLLRTEECPNCGGRVGPDMMFCPGCGYVLDDALRLEMERQREEAVRRRLDREYEERMRRFREEMRELVREELKRIERM